MLMKTTEKTFKPILLYLFVLIIIAFNGCNNNTNNNQSSDKSDLKGTITISGAFALYPIAVKWADEFQKLHPGVQIDISAGGAGKGITDALSEMVDLGMVSRSINPAEEAKGAWKIAVTKDAVVPVINSNNPVIKDLMSKGITKQKFTDIFVNDKLKQWGKAVDANEN